MLTRWLRRRQWRGSPQFEESVARAIEQARQVPGGQPAAYAKRKAARWNQPVRRKWVWKEALRQLEAEQRHPDP